MVPVVVLDFCTVGCSVISISDVLAYCNFVNKRIIIKDLQLIPTAQGS